MCSIYSCRAIHAFRLSAKGFQKDAEMINSNGCKEEWYLKWTENFDANTKVGRCSRCVYDTNTPSITFDEDGMCNYCQVHDKLCTDNPTGEEGEKWLQDMAETIRKAGRRKKFDVVVGVSGGCDSTYLIETAVHLGLRPLAVHFDNTWNSTIAVENIHCVLDKLGVELYTYVVDNEEYDDIYRSFLRAGTPDLDCQTDIALAATLYIAAQKYGIKYIFEGHSFRTEGLNPLGWLYMDAKYIQSVHKKFGELKMKTFPNMWFWSQMKWMVWNRIKKIRPLWHMEYPKEKIKKHLSDEYGWTWYGGHHLENRFTNFVHTYFQPRRSGIDLRANGYSAMIRSGQMTQEEGIEQLRQPPNVDMELVDVVKKRLDLDDAEFDRLMTMPKKFFTDYKTYKKRFERLRPLFLILAKADLIPMSFYIKYTSRKNI